MDALEVKKTAIRGMLDNRGDKNPLNAQLLVLLVDLEMA